MQKLIFTFTAFIAVFLTGCATNRPVFSDYPPIANGKGQLVIFSVTPADSKLRFSGQVECNGVLCARVVDGWDNHKGVYSVHTLTPREVVIKGPGKKWILFAGNVELVSNSLTVQIEPGKRTVAMVSLLEGSEFVGPQGNVGNARQRYRIDLISENEALPKIKGLAETKLEESLN